MSCIINSDHVEHSLADTLWRLTGRLRRLALDIGLLDHARCINCSRLPLSCVCADNGPPVSATSSTFHAEAARSKL